MFGNSCCLGCCWWNLEVMSTIRWACSVSRIQWWVLLPKVYHISISFSYTSLFYAEGELICPAYHELCNTVLVLVTGQCPKSCSFNGDCIDGTCHCFPGFHGRDCSRSEYILFPRWSKWMFIFFLLNITLFWHLL